MARTTWQITKDMFLSADELESLLAHLRRRSAQADGRARLTARLDQFVVEALAFSGVRNSEFCGLRLGDTPVVRTDAAFRVFDEADGSERIVYLPAFFADEVRRWVAEIRPHLLPPDVSPDDADRPLVYNEHRRPYERTGLYRRVVRILTEAGLGDRASVQLLRHTYGCMAYWRTGGNLLFVQRQLGHAHPMITSVYAQFAAESYPGMADQVVRWRREDPSHAVAVAPVLPPPPPAVVEEEDDTPVWLL